MSVRSTEPSAADGRAHALLGRALDRRRFLLGSLSTLALAGCAPTQAEDDLGTLSATDVTYTIDDLFSTSPFHIAHRGSGDNWPEHTMQAYVNSVEWGMKALEVSVNATKDGVLVCHHDTTMTRTSGEDVTIADVSWDTLSEIPIDAREWLGPAAAPQPIPRLEEVLDAFAATHVIFIEDKQGTNTKALLELMDEYPDSTSHFVWKQWAGATQYKVATARGYKTWGYFGLDIIDRAQDFAARFDYLGITHRATDKQVRWVVGFGKPVIAWEVHYRWVQARLQNLGVQGMMCSNVPYVTRDRAIATSDSFATGRRAAGDMPWTIEKGWAVQPTLDVLSGSLVIDRRGVQSYVMGSMCPLPATSYTIAFELRWPDRVPDPNENAGIAFGQLDDRPYRIRIPSDTPGYHMVFRANGVIELFSRPEGAESGTSLGAVDSDDAVPGEWVAFTITVSPDGIRVARVGLDRWSISVPDTTYRGRYFSLCKNYYEGPGVQFRSVSVS